MSTSAVSSSFLSQEQQYFQTRSTDLQQLGRRLGPATWPPLKPPSTILLRLARAVRLPMGVHSLLPNAIRISMPSERLSSREIWPRPNKRSVVSKAHFNKWPCRLALSPLPSPVPLPAPAQKSSST